METDRQRQRQRDRDRDRASRTRGLLFKACVIKNKKIKK